MDVESLATINLNLTVEVGLHETCMKDRDGYRTGVRPNHWIPGRDYTFAGQLDFQAKEWLRPGETCKASLSCVVATQDLHLMVPGFCWHICEANRIVGYAKIIGTGGLT